MEKNTAIVLRDRALWGVIPLTQFFQEISSRTVRVVNLETGHVSCSDPALEIIALGVQLVLRKVIETSKEMVGRGTFDTFAPIVDRLVNLGLLLTYPTVTEALDAFEREVLVPIRKAAAAQREPVALTQVATIPSATFFAALYKKGREHCTVIEKLHQQVSRDEYFHAGNLRLMYVESNLTSIIPNFLNMRAPLAIDLELFGKLLRDIVLEEKEASATLALHQALSHLPYNAVVLSAHGCAIDEVTTAAVELVTTHIVLALSGAPASKEYVTAEDLDAAATLVVDPTFDADRVPKMFFARMRLRGMTAKLTRAQELALRMHIRRKTAELVRSCRNGWIMNVYDSLFFDRQSLGEKSGGHVLEEAIASLQPESFLQDHGSFESLSAYVIHLRYGDRRVWLEQHVRPRISFHTYTIDALLEFLHETIDLYAATVVDWMEADVPAQVREQLWWHILYLEGEKRYEVPVAVVRHVLGNPAYEISIEDASRLFEHCPKERVIALLDAWLRCPGDGRSVGLDVVKKVAGIMMRLPKEDVSQFWTCPEYRLRFVTSFMRLYEEKNSTRSLVSLMNWMGELEWFRSLVAWFLHGESLDLDGVCKETKYDREAHPEVFATCTNTLKTIVCEGLSLPPVLRFWLGDAFRKKINPWLAQCSEEGIFLWLYAQDDSGHERWSKFCQTKERVRAHLAHLAPRT